ncbi:peptide alpha-N-acetyltransferase complex A subunit NAT1 [Sporobolomyces salmoneus]|uniref:peptide alpha-N-acetyltransferase complex A subunit NAT1 n=1 Tax=Sporobolomyces salmoneus TaxID=183962 RepID=UPI00317DA838
MPPRRKPIKTAAKPTATATEVPPVSADLPANRALAPTQAQLFRDVLGHYEGKEYTEGLAKTEQILAVKADHGESLCMKGLFLCCLDKKPEGYKLIEEGTEKDSGSHIVWHVYAIALRADKRWEETLECYRKACAIEKDSLNLLTDLSTLTVHLRRYEEFVEVRRSILRTQPRFRRNWLALAVAQYLARQFSDATVTLTYYENMLREVPSGDVEHGEVLLFHAQVLEDAGQLEQCLEFLSAKSGEIVDRAMYSVQRARLLLKLGRSEPAVWAWELLLEENPESREYIKSTVLAKGADCDSTTNEGRLKAVQVLDELAEKYPQSLAVRRLTLDLASGEQFRKKASNYLLSALSKGVPSLFADIKALYTDVEKQKVIGEIVESFRASLEEKGAIVTDQVSEDDSIESPSTYLWTLYFLSSHYSSISNHSLALETLAKAEAHTPSLPELPMLRARILKRAGDLEAAANAMEEARALDGQDRGLNCKSVKYLIRAGRVEEAEKIAGLFTKKDAPSPLEDLVEMQCLWILIEEGNLYLKQGNHGKALRRFHQILDTFQDIEEDQYDFHAYCIRKSTLLAYIQLLRFEDRVRDHEDFYRAAQGAIEIYLAMHDEPSKFKPQENGVANGKSDAEKEDDSENLNVYVDKDPLGLELLNTEEPLVQALRFVKPLQRCRPKRLDVWIMSSEIYLRQGKHLDAVRALRTAAQLSSNAPKTSSDKLSSLVSRLSEAVIELPESPLRSAAQAELATIEEQRVGGKLESLSIQ